MLSGEMRLGFVGPCKGDLSLLRSACERLLFEHGVARVVYLGNDDALDRALSGWREAMGAPADEGEFFDTAARLAVDAPAKVLDELLSRDKRASRLRDIGVIPTPPARAVEMFEDRVVLMVFDKGVLDEDDVANSTAIVWGHAPDPMLKPIGTRLFLTPGPLNHAAGPHVAVLDVTAEGVHAKVLDRDGGVKLEHKLSLGRGARMGVQ